MCNKVNKFAIILAGPTAVGKTKLSLNLANTFNTHIISADSRQIYDTISIGTAQPTPEELSKAPHHLVASVPLQAAYSAGQFERDSLKIAESIFSERNTLIVSGGSGMYIKAFTDGFDDMPPVPDGIRDQLMLELRNTGLTLLAKELKNCDPDYYNQVDLANGQRVVRALEVYRATGKPFSSFRKAKASTKRDFQVIKIGLARPRLELYERINQRVDIMLEAGLLEEARSVYPLRHLNALQTVGYKEVFGFLDGKYSWEECVRLLKRNTRHFAKRQLTWFTRDTEYEWFNPEDEQAIIGYIKLRLAGL